MTSNPAIGYARPAWFVGASFGGTDNQTDRFVEEGIWVNGYTNRYLELVRSIQPGDKIAIKATYTRKNRNGLPFDNRGYAVSVMAIRATGTVVENMGDGRNLRVDWTPVNPQREWYFYTYQRTVWRVYPGAWRTDQLIRFTFYWEDQDIGRFRNLPFWRDKFGDDVAPADPSDSPPDDVGYSETPPSYTIDSIIDDGCFLEKSKLELILDRLRSKQNLILQGPPGTGKTWLAKKLAYALIGHKDDNRVHRFQFHPNMSYEDFIRGYRPNQDGRLELVDGPFLEICETARKDLDGDYAIVIEEINRGNPAQIFGEMLTLLEADKRNPGEALKLAYPRSSSERFHIPPNVHVIGTMNVADRSIAMVDLALRRRFAFINLEPTFGPAWREWVSECGVNDDLLDEMEARMTALNQTIATDRSLGPQFRIGHSVVTPTTEEVGEDQDEWFRQKVETEITPLLDEYWFDNASAVESAKSKLLSGLS